MSVKRRVSWRRRAAAWAAAVCVFFAVGIPLQLLIDTTGIFDPLAPPAAWRDVLEATWELVVLIIAFVPAALVFDWVRGT